MNNFLYILNASATPLVALITYLLTSNRDKKRFSREKELEFYKVKIDNLTAEREMLTNEEKSLREMLREQLETCKIENERLDKEMENLKRRLLTIEQELVAWELGLKVPKGFELIQINTNETEVN